MTDSLDEQQLTLLVYGYASDTANNDWIIPDAITIMIHHYIPKAFWLKAGSAIEMNDKRDVISSKNTGWSTAYSTSRAKPIQEHKHRYIWKIEIIECGMFDDIRIGIASDMNELDDEFAYSEQGHNYSYITYGEQACVGYNGEFEGIKYVHYGPSDIISVELDLNDKCVTYYKNDEFVYKQNDIYCTNYRLAAAMHGNVSIKIVSFQRIFVKEKTEKSNAKNDD